MGGILDRTDYTNYYVNIYYLFVPGKSYYRFVGFCNNGIRDALDNNFIYLSMCF